MTFDELKQLDPKDPGRWPLPVRIGAIAVFFVIMSIVLVWFGVWNRTKDELATLEARELELREEFKNKHIKAVNLELFRQFDERGIQFAFPTQTLLLRPQGGFSSFLEHPTSRSRGDRN